MKTVIKHYEVFKFDELSDEAKEAALDKMREWNGQDSSWSECTIEDAKEIGKIIGIDIDNIYWSGFCSQGDGACFEGSYEYRKGSVKELKAYAPKDEELHRIALDLSKVQRRFFYQLSATVKHSGHYYHEMCTEISVYNDDACGNSFFGDDTYEGISELLRDFMRWIYKTLESEWDYQNSEKVLIEMIECNEYLFNFDGSVF